MKLIAAFTLAFCALILANIPAFGQHGFVTTGAIASNGSSNLTYVVGQMTNQTSAQLHFGVLQVFETTNEVLGTSHLSNFKISVFPNPTTQFLEVRNEAENLTSLNYQVIDLQGRLILSGQLKEMEPMIDLSNLARHQYQLLLFNDNKLIKTFKVIKN
ncbi:T9SS type A sorting domain-containing protein [Marinoscillum sp.]|uniref:T9SS type A sorting domain-containing protein n=1 Tax=Marinoscillum sp. TaxID=2024838 RepID=UPI003BA94911